ncbi:MAG: GAF and ANTAR domain-containing protein [Nocardioidaceae bacterium]
MELAKDTLADGFDVVHFLHMLANRCVELLNVDAAGILLSDQRGSLRTAGSTEHAGLIELIRLQAHEGPCLDAYRSGQPVYSLNMRHDERRWPQFARAASEAGYAAVLALPMRHREDTIGAVNLFRTTASGLDDEQVAMGQALADVATLGILHQRAFDQRGLLAEQLQTALNSRVNIEQAKGMLAGRYNLPMQIAFERLRGYARSHNRRLSELATAVARNQLDIVELI